MKKYLDVKIKTLHKDAVVPEYKTKGAAGLDLTTIESATIVGGDTVLLKTGLAMAVPEGYEAQVRPRSGMSLKTKVRISNAPGTLDSDYRGEIGVIIDNTGINPISIEKGERVAQLVFNKIETARFKVVDNLDDTERGEGGFGSTGIK